MQDWGFVRVTAASHFTSVANPTANAVAAIAAARQWSSSSVIVFQELSLSGYTCGDLFGQKCLLDSCLESLLKVTQATEGTDQLLVVGLPLQVEDRLYNVAAAVHDGSVLAIVPKQYLPNYNEFYEARWFAAADGHETQSVDLGELGTVPFGIDLLIQRGDLKVGIELCEDLWMPVPPSSLLAAAGANLLLNLSASNELIGKADWRRVLVRSQSGRCLAAYAYSSAGPSESTTDLVFGGHCMVGENGVLLAESERVGGQAQVVPETTYATADIDLDRLAHERRVTTSWQLAAQRLKNHFRTIEIEPASNKVSRGSTAVAKSTKAQLANEPMGRLRRWDGRPFVPADSETLHQRCQEIFGIQCAGLAKRLRRLPEHSKLFIGVSGGLDSSLALLVAVRTCQQYDWPTGRVVGITMPGFGTSAGSLRAARTLAQELNVGWEEVDIRSMCWQTFLSIGHHPFGIALEGLSLAEMEDQLKKLPESHRSDLVFENVQARVRTLILMSRGFVLGTGDLSEQALGWSTYNGDHMSMYNVNTSVPKTLVRFLIEYSAQNLFQSPVSECLMDIAATPISPELLPISPDGRVTQKTEESIGDYELHDFFLYHLIRFGMSPRKVLYLASLAKFSKPYEEAEIRRTLETFVRRFFSNQFKRSCVPDGPKVGSVSLSPRGDWRMPSDAEASAWLSELAQQQ